MRDLTKPLRRYLGVAVRDVKLKAEPPFAEVTLSVDGLLSLIRDRASVASLIDDCFVRRRVFWQDVRGENPEAVRQSLAEVEFALAERTSHLVSSNDIAVTELAKFSRAWGSATALVRKDLETSLRDIADEKESTPGYDSAGDDRRTVVGEALVGLRQRVYPLVYALISFLPDDDPVKADAEPKLMSGLDFVRADIVEGSIPELDEVEGVASAAAPEAPTRSNRVTSARAERHNVFMRRAAIAGSVVSGLAILTAILIAVVTWVGSKESGRLDQQFKTLGVLIQGHVNTLTEKIDGQGSMLTEKIDGQGSMLTERMDGQGSMLTERMDGNTATLNATIEGQEKLISAEFEHVDGKLDDIDGHIERLNRRIDAVDDSRATAGHTPTGISVAGIP